MTYTVKTWNKDTGHSYISTGLNWTVAYLIASRVGYSKAVISCETSGTIKLEVNK